MMYIMLFVASAMFIIYDLCKTEVNVEEESDMVTVEIRNFTCGEINITLD